MARLLGPDASSRLITQVLSYGTAEFSGRLATIYADAAGTQLADIAAYDGTSTVGASITGSQVRMDGRSRLPQFWFPDGVETCWAQPLGGPLTQINADATAGGQMTGPLTMVGSAAGGPDIFDSTSRVTIDSYQTNGNNSFGEGIRLRLNKFYSKNMIAWQLPIPVAGDNIENFLVNLSFEADTSSWSTVGAATFAINASKVLHGSESGRITLGTGAAGTQGVSQAVTGLVVGHSYTFGCWVYSPAGSPAVQLDIDGSGPTATSTSVDAWQELTLAWVATATSHTVRITNASAATSGQNVYVDVATVIPAVTVPKSIAWLGAHYQAQDLSGVHGHISFETPDAAQHLQTRFEIRFADRTTGVIGMDKTLVQTSAADFVVDCSAGQVLRLRTGAGAVKAIEWSNKEDGAERRWQLRQNGTTESGSNVGSDLEIARYADAGTTNGTPMIITRSSGRVTFGGTDGSQSGVTINRNSSGQALTINNTATGGTALGHVANTADAATGRTLQSSVLGESGTRFVQYADGKHEWRDGTNPADCVFYRSAAGILKTDTAMHVGTDFRHLGSNLGFYNAAQVTKPTVSGAKGSNAALGSLMTALAALGLVTDSTSA